MEQINSNAEPSWAGERNQRCGIPDENDRSSLLLPGLRTLSHVKQPCLVKKKNVVFSYLGPSCSPFTLEVKCDMKEVLSVLALSNFLKRLLFLKAPYFER